jgi:hypothetical protein
VVAGYTDVSGWLVHKGSIKGLSKAIRFQQGPVCSVDVGRSGRVVLGGYTSKVGIQVCEAGDSYRLPDDASDDADWFYHQVAISPDGNYVYAVSRSQPRLDRAGTVPLRAWYVGEDNDLHRKRQRLDRQELVGPLQAVAIHPESRRMILAISRVLSVWEIPGSVVE